MGKLIFKYTETEKNREASTIELTVPDDMNIGEYKIMCVRLAHSMGFQETSIQKEFGNLIYGNDTPHNIKTLLNEINNGGTTKSTRDPNSI